MRDDVARLSDAIEAVENVLRYTGEGRSSLESELVYVWVIHHLEILGEACRGVSNELRESHSDIPWGAIVGMRNVLAHNYFGTEVDLVWEAVSRDLPALRERFVALLASLE